jgi:SAM-dependent methyltransferase
MNLLSRIIQAFSLIGTKTYCPVCKKKNIAFYPLPELYRLNAERHSFFHFGKGEMTALDTYSCAECGASDRERLYAFWITNELMNNRNLTSGKTIHFAPEHSLSLFIKSLKVFDDYQTADLLMGNVNHNVDLMKLPFPAESYNFFICSHVLEHVVDDHAAICELFRITKKGGSGILMAPIFVGVPETIEDPTITDEGERWRLFGQNDHIRLYSHNDYVARIETCGFHVKQLDETYFGASVFKMLGLKRTSILYIVTKP